MALTRTRNGGTADGEEMMPLDADSASVRRGRRVAPRTEVCRPCLVWLQSEPQNEVQGVLLDLNPYGMRMRMLDRFERGTILYVQMMRDEEYQFPLSQAILVRVVYVHESVGGFVDHGLKRHLPRIRRPEEMQRTRYEPPRQVRRPSTRMYSLDELDLRRGPRRPGRGRG